MKLVLGGAYQGKKAYAADVFGIEDGWIDGTTCSVSQLKSCRGVDHFHAWIRRVMENNQEVDPLVEELLSANPQICIVTDELGYGVVPVDAADRSWREKTGRICTALAARADSVHRVVCGIGVVLKDGGNND